MIKFNKCNIFAKTMIIKILIGIFKKTTTAKDYLCQPELLQGFDYSSILWYAGSHNAFFGPSLCPTNS